MDMANDDIRDDRILRRRGRKSSDAVSRLCRSWLRAGTDAFTGSLRVAADTADDFSAGDDCRDALRRRDRDNR